MAIFTLSRNYIEGYGLDESHLYNVFLKFPNPESEHRAAMDRTQKLLSLYCRSAKSNYDIFTWLDFMSRRTGNFEIIHVDIAEDTSEEEMYLQIASATKPYKYVIVDNHQYYQGWEYISGTNKVLYKTCEICILDKFQIFNEINSSKCVIQHTHIENNETKNVVQNSHGGNIGAINIKLERKSNAKEMKNKSPWISGSFYLLALCIVITLLAFVAKIIPFYVLPIVVIGGIIAFSIIAAAQLRQDEKLNEKSFIELMGLSFRQIPFLNSRKNRAEDSSI